MLKKVIVIMCCVVLASVSFLFFHRSENVAQNPSGKKTVCLNMIVKNESTIIEKCLNSVKGIIDYWVIFDTGSTDGTQAIIKKCMKGYPGELHESPWVDFAHNRNEALTVAKDKADYSLFIDADEVLVLPPNFSKESLEKDFYAATIRQVCEGGLQSDYHRIAFVNNKLNWAWKGVLHELIESPQAKTYDILKEIVILSDTSKGARSKDPQKYLKDAQVLEKALEKEPDNSRYAFYLAQCYANAREYPQALKSFERRASMLTGFDEEIFWSIYMTARLQEILEMDSESIIANYNKAYQFRPTRAEPLHALGWYYLRQKNFEKAYDTLKIASVLPMVKDSLFIENWVYQWSALYKLAECCFHMGKTAEMREILLKLLSSQEVPNGIRDEIIKNLAVLKQMEDAKEQEAK